MAFYVKGSQSGSYVANQRDESGALLYEGAAKRAGLETQRALQTLSDEYATVINDAYSSHLSANRGVMGSAMGEGYKEQYLERQRQQLGENIAQAQLNSANARAQLEQSNAQTQANIKAAYETEVANIDRTIRSLDDYRTYLSQITNKDDNSGYFTEEQEKLGTEELYDVLINEDYAEGRRGYEDENKNPAMNFRQYLESVRTDTTKDSDYYDWLNRNGYQAFLDATSAKREKLTTAKAEAKKAEEEKAKKTEEEKKKAEEENKRGVVGSGISLDTKGKQRLTKNSTKILAVYNGKNYINNKNAKMIEGSSDLAQKITKEYNIKNKLDKNVLKIGDVIEYNNKKYMIANKYYLDYIELKD